MRIHRQKFAAVTAAVGLLSGLPAAWASGSAYAALGDSYVSGPGVPSPTGMPMGCGRSSQNYPRLVAAAIGAELTDVSCGAARTVNMTEPQPVGDGQNPPQFDALGPTTQMVTVGIGGNDLPFGEVVVTCGSLGPTNPLGAPCKTYYTSSGVDRATQQADAVGPKVSAVIQGIRERAPNARILFVGVPTVLPQTATTACFSQGVTIAAGDVPYLDQLNRKLNAVFKAAADANGVEFVDIYTSSQGHDMCKPAGVRWVEGLFPSDTGSPVHPNLAGMQDAARQVRLTLGY